MFISPKSTCLKRICIYDLSLYVFCAFLFWPIMFTDLYVWNIFASVFNFSVLSTCYSNKKQYFYKEKEGKYGCFFERFLRQLNRHSLYPSCSFCVWFWGWNTGFCTHKGPHWTTPPSHYILLNTTSTVLNLLPYHLNGCSEGRWCISQQKRAKKKHS